MPSAPRRPRADRTSLYLLGGLAAAIVLFLLWHRSSAAAAQDLSTSPSVRLGDQSGAAQPSGGAASIPDQLPTGQTGAYVYQPATSDVGAQVQTTDAGAAATGSGVSSSTYATPASSPAAYYPVLSGPPPIYQPPPGNFQAQTQAAATNYAGGIPGVEPIAGVLPGSGKLTSRGKVVP